MLKVHEGTELPIRTKQLIQLLTPVPDGCVISDSARDKLVKDGLVSHLHGWNMLTIQGLLTLEALGYVSR